MAELCAAVLDMSLKASAVICAVLFLRLLLRRAPRIWSYVLWSVVLFRLLCPVSFESEISVVPGAAGYIPSTSQLEIYKTMVPGQEIKAAYLAVEDVLDGGLDTVTVNIEPEYAAEVGMRNGYAELLHPEVWFLLFCRLWPIGAAVMAGRGLFSLLVLRRKLRGAICREKNVYEVEGVETAFVLGLFRPGIYLPDGLTAAERTCVLCHERHHIRRCDHIIKVLAFGALCLHWFNPLVWLAFRLAGADMEMSCDEAVIKELGADSRAAYAQSLLNLATGRRMAVGTPLAFGEGDTKGRIKNMLNWKKPRLWVSMIAMLVCIVGICACASDPVEPEREGSVPPTQGILDPVAQEEPAQEVEYTKRRGLAFEELKPGRTIYLNEDVVLVGKESRVEWQGTYARTGLTLQVGLRAHANGTEYVTTVEGGSGTGVFEYMEPGCYTPFVRNVEDTSGYQTDISPNAAGAVNFDLILEEDYFQNGTPWPETEEQPPKLPDDAQILGPLPGNISLMPNLYAAVLDHHRSPHSDQNFCCASIVVLDNQLGTRMHPVTGGDLSTMDYFLWVLYQEYQFTEDGIVHKGGAHIPTNITLAENGDGSWSVHNYWEPGDGSYYVEDIKGCFPTDIVDEALDSQKYIMGQVQDCYAQAVAYAKSSGIALDTERIISDLLDVICSSPTTSSNPGDYISEHSIEYRELLYYGDYTRDYCQRHLYGMGVEDAGPAEIGLPERVMERLLADLGG